MKKSLILLVISLLLASPLFALSAPNLASKLKGKILLAVEDHGKTYYVHSDGNRYQITVATAQKIFEKLALGITNKGLKEIPLKDVGIKPEQAVLGEKIVYVDKPVEKTVYVNQQCDYSPYTDKINSLNATLGQSNDAMKKGIDYITQLKAENATCDATLDKLNITAQGLVDAANRAIKLSDDWKQMYYDAIKASAPVATTPVQMPVIKCFYGTTMECFDLNTFPADFISTLNGIAQKPITMQSIVGSQLRAIHDYLGY